MARRTISLADLRRRRGLTQARAARKAGMRQSDLSKFERRADVRLSSLRAFARALGGRIETDFVAKGVRLPIRLGPRPRRRPRAR